MKNLMSMDAPFAFNRLLCLRACKGILFGVRFREWAESIDESLVLLMKGFGRLHTSSCELWTYVLSFHFCTCSFVRKTKTYKKEKIRKQIREKGKSEKNDVYVIEIVVNWQ